MSLEFDKLEQIQKEFKEAYEKVIYIDPITGGNKPIPLTQQGIRASAKNK